MSEKRTSGALGVFRLTLLFQMVILTAAGISYWQVSRYLEFSLRRSVTEAAGQAVHQ